MVAIGRGGGGGRVRSMGNFDSHAKSLENDIIKKKNMSRFNVFNSGCFTKSDSAYCPTRLTDYYCVTWSAAADLEHDHLLEQSMSNTTSQATLEMFQESEITEVCGGDFVSETIILINLVLPIIVVLLGTVTNLVTCRLLIRYAKKQLPICYFAAVLEVINLIVLYIRFLDLWLQSVFDIRFNYTVNIMDRSVCQLYNGMYSGVIHFKSILQIALILDIKKIIQNPTFYINKRNNDWERNVIILTTVIVTMLNTQSLWTLDIVQENAYTWFERTDYCGWTITWPIAEVFTIFIWPMTDLLLGDFLPFFTVTICSISCITKSWKTGFSNNGLKQHIIDVPLFISLRKGFLACSVAYAALYFPQILHDTIMYIKFFKVRLVGFIANQEKENIIQNVQLYKNVKIYNNLESETRLYIARVLFITHLIVNFFILNIFVPQFRREVIQLFTGHWFRSRCSSRSNNSYNRQLLARSNTALNSTEEQLLKPNKNGKNKVAFKKSETKNFMLAD